MYGTFTSLVICFVLGTNQNENCTLVGARAEPTSSFLTYITDNDEKKKYWFINLLNHIKYYTQHTWAGALKTRGIFHKKITTYKLKKYITKLDTYMLEK